MDKATEPLVSIVTPVYNNVEHFTQCIESVLSQTYQNWEYIIVNNCSTDGSAEIAHRYAKKDPRIRVLDNETFLRAVPNHNHSLRQISRESKYLKIVFADDWIFPRCLEEMVALAEQCPTAGIIGAYGLQGVEVNVKWAGLPYPVHLISGRELCRRYFFERLYVFGTSHSVLFRADLVRSHDPFFNESNLHADREICLVLLTKCDFAFVHQVLTFTRERLGSLTAFAREMNTMIAAELYELVTYGHDYLTDQEYKKYLNRLLSEYYNFLAVRLVQGRRDERFWQLHKRKFADAGIRFSRLRLFRAVVVRILRAVLHPHETVAKMTHRGAQIV
ncbi:MAG: glycosyltransferase family 2 protein [Gammaproteobacteria bacterium]